MADNAADVATLRELHTQPFGHLKRAIKWLAAQKKVKLKDCNMQQGVKLRIGTVEVQMLYMKCIEYNLETHCVKNFTLLMFSYHPTMRFSWPQVPYQDIDMIYSKILFSSP